jgi:hypothetical protein
MTGPTVGGALGDAFGDAVPYLVGAAACALTLAATTQVAARKARTHAV